MAEPRSLHALATRLAGEDGRAAMVPVIEKELLHYDILDELDRFSLLARLSFQGGTCLRLCYGSERYSEDLDFAGGSDFNHRDFVGLA
jgi:predicted nucleotidyltransferase component of viral defense system